METCPDCNSTKIIRDYEHGEVVCGKCGLVLGDPATDIIVQPDRTLTPGAYRKRDYAIIVIDEENSDLIVHTTIPDFHIFIKALKEREIVQEERCAWRLKKPTRNRSPLTSEFLEAYRNLAKDFER